MSPYDCQDSPEYHAFPTSCFQGVEADADWIGLELVDSDGRFHWRYQVTIDPEGLALGTHESRIWLYGASDCCMSTCMPVVLEVLAPQPTYPTSWGRLKSRY